jgi:hypothetical protein
LICRRDILPDERQYTRALSLSRLTYDLENLLSPSIAAVLPTVASFHWLFAGNALSFLASALVRALECLPAADLPPRRMARRR